MIHTYPLPLHVRIEKRNSQLSALTVFASCYLSMYGSRSASQLIILTVFATSRMRHAIIRLVALIMYCDRVSYVGLTRGN